MTAIVDTDNGKQVVVSAGIHLKIYAYGGSLGIDLSDDAAFEIAGALIAAVRKRRKAG